MEQFPAAIDPNDLQANKACTSYMQSKAYTLHMRTPNGNTDNHTEVQASIGEFSERRVAAEDELNNIDIRAPQDGVVHQLAVHAPGAVVAPGNPIMVIVPVSDNLIAEVRIAPQDIDQLSPGQEAGLRFSAFHQATTPEISGKVAQISALAAKASDKNAIKATPVTP